mgnify:CR=1 FL=1|tara:strand:- start:4464 stop:4805 length:342 start_codon:yes stop_codon:yes gene_type:complete
MSDKKKRKKPYFPNNWKAYKDAPSEYFEDLPFEQFMDWRVNQWEIPSSIDCIIREQNLDTGKVTEYVYQSAGHAQNKVRAMMDKGESEFFIANKEGLHHLYPKFPEDYDDPLA